LWRICFIGGVRADLHSLVNAWYGVFAGIYCWDAPLYDLLDVCFGLVNTYVPISFVTTISPYFKQ
jgi:hypothetical protein